MAGIGDEVVLYRGSGGTSDLSQNSYNGTYQNSMGTVTDASIGSIVVFSLNGTNQYMSLPSFWDSDGPVTMMWWQKVPTGASANGIGGRGTTTSDRFSTHAPFNDDSLYWDYGDNNDGGRISADYTSLYDQWVHVALVSEGAGGSFQGIYIDGVLESSQASSEGPTGAITFSLGRASLGVGTYYQSGSLNDFRVFRRVLLPSEIASAAGSYEYDASPEYERVPVGRAVESDAASSVSVYQGEAISVGQASEADSAKAATVYSPVVATLGRAAEKDQAFSLVAALPVSVGVASESDTARAPVVSNPASVSVGRATETSVARSVAAGQVVEIGRATESNTASSATAFYAASVGRAVESSTANDLTLQQDGVVFAGRATETSVANGVTVTESSGSFIMQFYHQMLAG